MDELVKRLRRYVEIERSEHHGADLEAEAADAIEELQGRVKTLIRKLDEANQDADYANEAATALYGALPRWIPVTERLPEEDTDVLCWYEYYHWSAEKVLPEYGIGHCWNGQWGGEVSNGRECKVLAWMPLPQPPKEE